MHKTINLKQEAHDGIEEIVRLNKLLGTGTTIKSQVINELIYSRLLAAVGSTTSKYTSHHRLVTKDVLNKLEELVRNSKDL